MDIEQFSLKYAEAYKKSKESWDKYYEEQSNSDSVHYFFTEMTQEEFNEKRKQFYLDKIEEKDFEFNTIGVDIE